MKYILLSLSVIGIIALAGQVHASTYQANQNGILSVEAPGVGPLYSSGDQVVLNVPVPSDFVAAGNTVWVKQSVGGSILMVASKVTIDGDVKHSLRVASGETVINSTVDEDATIIGGKTRLSRNAHVRGDLHMAGGAAVIDGQVDGSVYYTGQSLTVNGTVQKNVFASTGSLLVSDEATVDGNVTYVGDRIGVFAPGAVKGRVSYTSAGGALPQARILIGLFTNLLVGALLILTFRHKLQRIAGSAAKNALRGGAIGLFVLLIVPLAAMLLAVTLIGMPLSLSLLGLYFMLLYFSYPIAATIIGLTLMKRFGLSVDERWTPYLALVIGLICFNILTLIPGLGPLIVALVWLISVGLVLQYDLDLISGLRAKKIL